MALLSKINGGPFKDLPVTSEQKDGYIAIKRGDTMVATITPNSGTTEKDVFDLLQHKVS